MGKSCSLIRNLQYKLFQRESASLALQEEYKSPVIATLLRKTAPSFLLKHAQEVLSAKDLTIRYVQISCKELICSYAWNFYIDKYLSYSIKQKLNEDGASFGLCVGEHNFYREYIDSRIIKKDNFSVLRNQSILRFYKDQQSFSYLIETYKK